MALNIEFEGFVNEVKTFDWGTVARMSHSQRAKNDAGQWETIGKDYLDVTLPAGETVAEGGLVKVKGTFKVSTFDKKDGTTGIAIKVRAQEVSVVIPRGSDRQPGGNTQHIENKWAVPGDWTPLSDEAPF